MGPQAHAFFDSEGGEWLKRNKHKLPIKDDPVLEAIKGANIRPKSVLEIGCADGWRLKELAKIHKCECHGIDPGVTHTQEENGVRIYRGAADSLHIFKDAKFDLVIYGFCLYLCDPEDYFKIAMEGDRVLADGGHLIVYDFQSPTPHRRLYAHKRGLYSHKMDFTKLWLSHPAYSLVTAMIMGQEDDCTAVMILKKRVHSAFPIRNTPHLTVAK